MASSIDPDRLYRLSDLSRHTAASVEVQRQAGLTTAELCASLGITRDVWRRRVERLQRELLAPEPRRCSQCGEPLPFGSRSHRETCSSRCRTAASRARLGSAA